METFDSKEAVQGEVLRGHVDDSSGKQQDDDRYNLILATVSLHPRHAAQVLVESAPECIHPPLAYSGLLWLIFRHPDPELMCLARNLGVTPPSSELRAIARSPAILSSSGP